MAALGETLRAFDAAFREIGVRWYVFGAQAAIAYGVARSTADVDVTIEPGTLDTRAIATALEAEGFRLRFADPDFVDRTRVLAVIHSSGMPADVVLGGSGFEQLFLERAARRRIDGANVPVAAAEDIIAMKVLAGREKTVPTSGRSCGRDGRVWTPRKCAKRSGSSRLRSTRATFCQNSSGCSPPRCAEASVRANAPKGRSSLARRGRGR